MNGLMWWVDRWRKSTAYTSMTVEQQGAYRNLLDEATLRGGVIPNDPDLLAKACGDPRIWKRIGPTVMARFKLTPEGWRNETLDQVLTRMAEITALRSAAGQKGNRSRWGPKSA